MHSNLYLVIAIRSPIQINDHPRFHIIPLEQIVFLFLVYNMITKKHEIRFKNRANYILLYAFLVRLGGISSLVENAIEEDN